MANNDYHRRLDLIVQHTTNMVVVTNSKREIEWVNPAYTRVTGWTLEEVRGRNPKSFLHGPRTSRAAAAQLGTRLRQGLPVQDFEMLNYTKGGTPYWVSLSIQPVVGDDGTIAEYVAIQTDITERKRREGEMASAYKRLAEAQRLSGIGYMEHDLSTGKIRCSPEIIRLAELPEGTPEASYEYLMSCTHPEDQAEVQARYELAVNCSEAYESEHRVLTAAGQVRWIHMRGALEGWDDGTPALCRLVVQDVTERKQAEQLARDKALLEQVARTQMEVLARVSHELRTPLHAVLGFTEIIERTEAAKLAPRARGHLAHIGQAARHLLAIVNDVLELTHIHSGRAPLALQAVPLHRLCEEVAALLEPLAAARSIRLRVEPRGEAVLARADRQRLSQVLINLVGNALKFTPEGGAVRVAVHEAEDGQVRAEVRDTGPGIAPEHRARLFEPFYRIDAPEGTPAAGAPGSGLGLAIAQTLVRSMGGDVLVHSEPGAGACFSVVLPRAALVSPTTLRSVRPEPVAPGPAEQPATGLLLYIEDNEVNHLLLESYLAARPDLTLVCETRGAAGLAAARRLRPTLILIDLQLPDMTGHELIAAILDDPVLYRTPCVAFSAESGEQAVAEAVGSGFREYLHKPIPAADFLRAIDRLMREAHTAPAFAAS